MTSLSLSCIGKGNGNPLQCSCLENPRDGGAWWAAIRGVTQRRTRLKQLSSSSSSSSRTAYGLLWWLSGKESTCHAGERKKESEVTQSCPTLCDPVDCSLPGSSVHGIFQAIVLEWVAIPLPRVLLCCSVCQAHRGTPPGWGPTL